MRYVELRRHTDNDGDRLTPQGIANAEAIAVHPPYAAFVVRHSPTNEAAVPGLTAQVVPPLGKGDLITEDAGQYQVES